MIREWSSRRIRTQYYSMFLRTIFSFLLLLPLLLISCRPTTIPQAPQDLRHLAGHLSVMQRGIPTDLDFCGMPVPLEQDLVRDRLHKEVKQHLRYPAGARMLYKRSHRYQDRFQRILRSQGIPEDFFYLAMAESGLANLKSPVGARGFWQFMEGTARQYGLEVSSTVDERYHPEKATYAACRYLKTHHKQFGDWALVAASYNMGGGGLSRAINTQSKNDYFSLKLNRETQRYLYRILSYKIMMEYPEDFDIDVNRQEVSHPIAYSMVEVTENIADLATFAKAHGSSYLMLKTLNPWLIADKLVVSPGKTYEIRFPLVEAVRANELVIESLINPEMLEETSESLEELSPSVGDDKAIKDS